MRPDGADVEGSTDLLAELSRLRRENARLLRLLKLSSGEADVPGPAQSGIFHEEPGPVHASSSPAAKVALFARLFGARRDVYAVRWENVRIGRAGWMPAVRGRWRKGMRPDAKDYLPLTEQVLTAHLSGQLDIGLYPLLDGDQCHWLAADFDGPAAMLDALGVSEGRPCCWRARGPGGVPFGFGRSRLAVFRCAGCCRDSPPVGFWVAS